MKSYLLFILAILFSNVISAQTIFWTGDDSQQWNNSNNWLPKMVPNASDDVFIGAVSSPVIYETSSSTIKSLFLAAGAEVIIEKGSSLEFSKPSNRGMRIRNGASVTNEGNLFFNEVPGDGILVEGTLTNEKKGLIQFKEVGGRAFSMDAGTFHNNGFTYLMGGSIGTGISIRNSSILNNTGGILMEEGYSGTFSITGSSVNNYGDIDLSMSTTLGSLRMLQNASFINHADAAIKIDNYVNAGAAVFISIDSKFENAGLVDLKNKAGSSTPFTGISLRSKSFENYPSGVVNITAYTRGIGISSNQKFNNYGVVNLYNISSTGISNEGLFNNLGNLLISGQTGLLNWPTGGFINEAGGIVSEVTTSTTSIRNHGSIINAVCSEIILKNRVTLVQAGTIKNYGYFSCIEDGIGSGGADQLINYGLVVDPFERFSLILDNQGIYVSPLDNLVSDLIFIDALGLGDVSDFEVNFVWHDQMPLVLNNETAYYTESSNELSLFDFYSNNPTESYFTTITHLPSGCEWVVEVPVAEAIQPYVTKVPDYIELEDTEKKSPVSDHSIIVTPNPNFGNFEVALPMNQKGNVDCEILDLNGRILASYKNIEAANLQFDLQNILTAGMYLIRVTQAQELIAVERIVVN